MIGSEENTVSTVNKMSMILKLSRFNGDGWDAIFLLVKLGEVMVCRIVEKLYDFTLSCFFPAGHNYLRNACLKVTLNIAG